jgi:hypothetical protein
VRSTVEALCSQGFAGRGYVNDGNQKAADFIKIRIQKTRPAKLLMAITFRHWDFLLFIILQKLN